jgi:hypothetical protein
VATTCSGTQVLRGGQGSSGTTHLDLDIEVGQVGHTRLEHGAILQQQQQQQQL